MARWQFFFKTLRRYMYRQDISCPHCGSSKTKLLNTKYLVLQLRQCVDCCLMFRYPKDDVHANLEFYQEDYNEGITTKIPDDKTLQHFIDSAFSSANKDFSEKIEIIKRFKQKGSVLDYGCSWGYGVWQFNRTGFNAVGFEISKPRALLGIERLGVKIISSQAELDAVSNNSFDIIFANHILEHLPHLYTVFKEFHRLLKDDGLIAIFVPNCTGCEDKEIFNQKKSFAIGEKHTMAMGKDFFEKNFLRYGFDVKCFSHPYRIIDDFFSTEAGKVDTSSIELAILARKQV